MRSISRLATETIDTAVKATDRTAPTDPTIFPVQFAFMAGAATPATPDWHDGYWESISAPAGPTYIAVINVGPGGFVVAVGTWTVWVRVITAPETPLQPVGLLEIY